MKNKYMTFVALAATALATSCTSDDLAEQKQNQGEPRTVTLTASVADDNTTRVAMTKDGNKASFCWQWGDRILVQTVDNDTYSGAEFVTYPDEGATTATFEGEVTGTVGKYAVYPYSANHEFTSATALTFNLPARYFDYKPETNIFDVDGFYPLNSTNMPMLGTIADGKISFKPLGGLAVIRIDQMPATSGTLTVTSDNQQLSGNFTVSDLSATEPVIATSDSYDTSKKEVTFYFYSAQEGCAGVFYLPLATGEYTSLEIKIETDSDARTFSYGRLAVARKGITAIPLSMMEE